MPASGIVSSSTLTFNNANGSATSAGVEYGSLRDGRWLLSIPIMNYTSMLHRLFGDSNGDGSVDGGTDFGAFGSVFGTSVAGTPPGLR